MFLYGALTLSGVCGVVPCGRISFKAWSSGRLRKQIEGSTPVIWKQGRTTCDTQTTKKKGLPPNLVFSWRKARVLKVLGALGTDPHAKDEFISK